MVGSGPGGPNMNICTRSILFFNVVLCACAVSSPPLKCGAMKTSTRGFNIYCTFSKIKWTKRNNPRRSIFKTGNVEILEQ